jgi:hypothetical protein
MMTHTIGKKKDRDGMSLMQLAQEGRAFIGAWHVTSTTAGGRINQSKAKEGFALTLEAPSSLRNATLAVWDEFNAGQVRREGWNFMDALKDSQVCNPSVLSSKKIYFIHVYC